MIVRALAAALAFGIVTATVPARWCAWDADALWEGALHDDLARGVATRLDAGVTESDFATGAERFDGEWAFGAHMMAAVGFGQLAAAHPEHRAAHLADMERALDRLLAPEVRAYDTAAWGEDALDGLGGPNAHLGWLAYVGVPLGMHRQLAPESRFADVGDRIAEHLRAHLAAVPAGRAETYPGERYPVDNAVAAAAIAHHARATGRDPGLAGWSRALRVHVDPASGLLVQAVDAAGRPVDAPRGSGTFFAAFFLADVDAELSRALWEAGRGSLYADTLGFGTMREYPPGRSGPGDIDSGPVILGRGVSATGFALGVARAHGDAATFRRLLATATLVGAPVDTPHGRRWTSGGPLGDAILLAMLTRPEVR